jgi:uncharacterized protein with FMN-binding domain
MNKRMLISGAICAIVIAGIVVFGFSGSNKTSTTTPVPVATVPTATVPVADTTGTATNKYKNGTYSAVGTYTSPEGQENITVSVTLKNGVIVATSATNGAHDGTSRRYQNMFIGGYQALVVGKSIDSVSLDRVSGSSLTPAGFNNALAQIKTQAQA